MFEKTTQKESRTALPRYIEIIRYLKCFENPQGLPLLHTRINRGSVMNFPPFFCIAQLHTSLNAWNLAWWQICKPTWHQVQRHVETTNDTNRRNVLCYGSSNTCEASSTISPPVSRITNGFWFKIFIETILRQSIESFQSWDNFNHFTWRPKCVSACNLGANVHKSIFFFCQNRWRICNIFCVRYTFCLSLPKTHKVITIFLYNYGFHYFSIDVFTVRKLKDKFKTCL